MFFSITNKNKKIKKKQIVPLRYNPKNDGKISPFEKIFDDDWIVNDKIITIIPFDKGSTCLIGNIFEKFWVEISEIDKHNLEYIGKIITDLIEPRFYDKGCLIRFNQSHILQTFQV